MIEDIGEGVRELNVLAEGIQDEVKKQNIMLDDLDLKIDNVNDHLENVNTKVQENKLICASPSSPHSPVPLLVFQPTSAR